MRGDGDEGDGEEGRVWPAAEEVDLLLLFCHSWGGGHFMLSH